MIDAALNSENTWLRDITRNRLEREGHVRLNFSRDGVVPALRSVPTRTGMHAAFLPFAEGNFKTASGKAELFSEKLKQQGLDPVIAFTPPSESRHSPQAKAFPLELLARKADNFLNSTFCNIRVTQKMEEAGLLEMNTADARARGIADGDTVRVFNRRGDILLRARAGRAMSGLCRL